MHCGAIRGALLALLLAGCSGMGERPSEEETVAEVQRYISAGELVDDRGRFREIFCTVLDARGESLPDYRPCAEALRSTGPEAGATGAPVDLGRSRAEFLFLFVPGLGWDCVENWLKLSGSAIEHLARFGYEARRVPVEGLSSSARNAGLIRDYVAQLPPEYADRPIVLAGYSKGAPDILEALVSYPELRRRVRAVVSMAGVVHGSPLAESATQGQANLMTLVPGSECDKDDGDNDAVRSLLPAAREQWLAEHPLPPEIRYFSVVSFPQPDRVSLVLKTAYAKLSHWDVRNDGQATWLDQIIPGSSVVALLNADHWAVAVPVARSHGVLGSTLVNHNDYPREAMLEALLRYLEEQLGPM